MFLLLLAFRNSKYFFSIKSKELFIHNIIRLCFMFLFTFIDIFLFRFLETDISIFNFCYECVFNFIPIMMYTKPENLFIFISKLD